MANWIKQLFCRHEYIFMRFRHYRGGIINLDTGKDTEGTLIRIGIKCRKCDKIKLIELFGEEKEAEDK